MKSDRRVADLFIFLAVQIIIRSFDDTFVSIRKNKRMSIYSYCCDIQYRVFSALA